MRRLLTLALPVFMLASLAGAPSASAGPWTPAPGSGFAKISLRWLPGFGYHDQDGATIDYGAYHEVFLATYLEAGIVPNIAWSLNTDVLRTFTLTDPETDETETHIAPGDPEFALRWRFLQAGRFVAAAEAGVRFPIATSDPVQTVRARETFDEVGQLRIGAGTVDARGTLSLGYGGDWFYFAASGGFVYRNRGYDPILQWSAEAGATFGSFATRVRVIGFYSLDIGGSAERTNSPSGIGNGTAFTGFAVEGDYWFTQSVALGLAFHGAVPPIRGQTGGPVIEAYFALRF